MCNCTKVALPKAGNDVTLHASQNFLSSLILLINFSVCYWPLDHFAKVIKLLKGASVRALEGLTKSEESKFKWLNRMVYIV